MYTAVAWHVFIHIFQTEHLSAVQFAMGYEKNMYFLAKVFIKVEKIWTGSFKSH